jgi:hypothetical protein
MTSAIELVNVTKVYRRYGGRQFSTLKSALLQRSILRLRRKCSNSRRHLQRLRTSVYRKRVRQEHGAEARAGINSQSGRSGGCASRRYRLGAGTSRDLGERLINGIMLGLSNARSRN